METGRQIIQHFLEKKLNYQDIEMILVGNHAPFTWGKNSQKALYNAAVLEEIARMAWLTEQINPQAPRLKDALIKKHFERKHGPDAYYGQQ
jgi:L-ribulose-5-phosphate 4-epimerase